MNNDKTSASVTVNRIDPKIKIYHLFKIMLEKNSSDLHLRVGIPPCLRIYGDVSRIKSGVLAEEDAKRLIEEILTDEQKDELKKELEIDFSFSIKGLARFRGNVFHSNSGLCGVFRLIPSLIPDFKQLNLPNVLLKMMDITSGIILVTGPTGSGKSTTLASMLDIINKTRKFIL